MSVQGEKGKFLLKMTAAANGSSVSGCFWNISSVQLECVTCFLQIGSILSTVMIVFFFKYKILKKI